MNHPLVSDGHSAASHNGPGVPGAFGRSRHRKMQRRDDPADVADVGRAAGRVGLRLFQRLDLPVEPFLLSPRRALNRARELLFLFRVFYRAEPFQVLLQQLRAGQIDQYLVAAGLNREFRFDSGDAACAVGDLAQSLQDRFNACAFGVARPAPDLRVFGDDVRHVAAFDDHVMDAGRRPDVFAQQVDAVREGFGAVRRAAPVPRIERGVRGPASELDDEIDQGLRAVHVGSGFARRMPRQANIQIFEQAVARHVDLAVDRLFRRRPVEANRPFEFARGHQLFDRDGRAKARHAEQVVTAAVAWRACFERLLDRRGFLRDAGQRVEFTEDADDRAPLPVGRNEGRRHSGDATLDFEAFTLGVTAERLRRLALAQRGFGEGPDLVAEFDHFRLAHFDGAHGFFFCLDVRGAG